MALAKRLVSGGQESLSKEQLLQITERFICGGGTFPVIGSYDQCAQTFKRLSDAGLTGMAIGLVNYALDMPGVRDELLPRMKRLGLRAGPSTA